MFGWVRIDVISTRRGNTIVEIFIGKHFSSLGFFFPFFARRSMFVSLRRYKANKKEKKNEKVFSDTLYHVGNLGT